ncbi:MAG: hypothetical protein COW11_04970 [Candidatus Omnitrophica bacterium CG12_big_fil_rev_8_21_14_0_65_43_15]|uniref:SpoVT-AbrB domain-containing protein n=1 Tax=Candidatus Taenaricola geysiri TaxID=1974752 RepID=A0A2J0LKJ1_9BACT|nr:MAG: hypothetical protein COU52_01895 [Candidatus Omnitrophica bacterium CG10_big_fil_rev_8_21_14_0_10_43_8]PIW66123.1 MAG: hypothetical protein COW11_04970 [Candidatus Omnitrophica bacterium CG12_big_fil_rev_8_21_14_0_65_43_15]PJC45822.1 MAG: hypothetical protein CO036_05950 [Candidatus Omnitrophica bacterium CG_4_9_14_0_2_um_filter_43_12]
MISKLTRANQITIPRAIVAKIGLNAGSDYFEIGYQDGIIYLKPLSIEERIPKEVLEKIKNRALKEGKGDITINAKEAEGFLVKRARKR